MPQAVSSFFYYLVATLAVSGFSAGAAVALSFAATAAVVVGSIYALQKISEALIGLPKLSRPAQDVEYSGTIEPRRIIYGEMLVAGMNVIPPMTNGENNEYLNQVLAVAGHQCNSLGQVYFSREAIGTVSGITGTDDDGKVTTGRYSNKAWVRRYTGTGTQTVDYKLATAFPSQWTANHRGQGVAYIALTYQFDEEVYRQGKPEVTCLVQGKKVYDPRLDSTRTGGSGSQRISDPATWTFSTNPALCLADFLFDNALGLGESDSRIDYDKVMDAADICDEDVTIPGSTTQKRYTCNAVLVATDAFEENIKALAQAMAGICYYSSGKWRMYAGAWSASAFTLGDSDLIDGGISVVTAYPYKDRYNSVRGTFIDKDNNWQATEYTPIITSSYVTADGEKAWLETDFVCCTNQYEAQRHAILIARRSRNAQVATVRCGLSAFKIRPFETGTVTFSEIGWTSKSVRCEGWRFDPAGFVELTLREEASTDWNDPVVADYTVPTAINEPTPSGITPPPPTDLSSSGLQNLIFFKWVAPSGIPADAFYELFEHTSSTPFSSATKIWSGTSTSTVIEKNDTTVRYYWVRSRVPSGGASTTEPPSTGIASSTLTISSVLGASAVPTSIEKTDTTASITTASTTVTASGGTSPYTYAWTRNSGSTAISANSASAATTTFTGSSLASGTTYSAVFRCTVTDNAAATKTVDVNVSITRAAITASASPATLYEQGGTGTITTASTTVSVSGGTSPYTYSWAKQSGDTLTVTSSTAATTTFSTSGIAEGDSKAATYRCTVTDSTTPTALTATADVFVTIENPYEGIPP